MVFEATPSSPYRDDIVYGRSLILYWETLLSCMLILACALICKLVASAELFISIIYLLWSVLSIGAVQKWGRLKIVYFLPLPSLIVYWIYFYWGSPPSWNGIIYGWTLMPCPFTGRKMFCAGPNFLCRNKNLFTHCASHKHFVPYKKMICIQ